MSEYIPRNDGHLILWLTNYATRLTTHGKSLGVSDTEVKTQSKLCEQIIDAIKNDDEKHRDWRSAVKATQNLKQTGLPEIRAVVARLKVAPGWSTAIGQAMGVISPSPQALSAQQLDTARPSLRADVSAGRVVLRFVRRPFDGLNIYSRRKGEGTWRFVGHARKSPYVDPTPLATPNSAEIREYQAVGVRKDQELGQPSDVVVIPLRD